MAFPRGDFNAVSDHNSRSCWTRRQYGEIECPLHVNGGWLTDNTNTNTQKFLTLSSTENEICSNLHCMGGIIETQESLLVLLSLEGTILVLLVTAS